MKNLLLLGVLILKHITVCHPGKQIGSHKKVSPFKKNDKKHGGGPIDIKAKQSMASQYSWLITKVDTENTT